MLLHFFLPAGLLPVALVRVLLVRLGALAVTLELEVEVAAAVVVAVVGFRFWSVVCVLPEAVGGDEEGLWLHFVLALSSSSFSSSPWL